VIVSARGRAFDDQTNRAHAKGTLPNFPIVVMIDSLSASASEIFAGALADNKRAKILGERSFGKASIQGMYTLKRTNAELKVTEGRYELPSGVSPHREVDSVDWGVDPSPGFYVPMDGQERFDAITTQLEQEVIANGKGEGGETREGGEGGQGEEVVDWSDTDAVLAALGDRQLDAAVEALQVRIADGVWTAVGEDPPSGEDLASAGLARLEQSRDALLRDLTALERHMADLRTSGATEAEPDDLWPDTELTGGRVEVFDAQGERVALLDITGEDLETWLIASGVEVREADDKAGQSGGEPESEDHGG